MSSSALTAYREGEDWEKCNKSPYNCEHLRSICISEFFRLYAGASDEEIAMWFTYGGYDIYHDDVQASIFVDDGELYGADIEHHHFVREGYQSIVTALCDSS